MPDRTEQVAQWQRAILAHGAQLGTTGPQRNGVDGDFGPVTLSQSIAVLDNLAAAARAEAQRADELQRRLDGVRRTVELADSITALLDQLSDDVQRADGRLQAILDEVFGRSAAVGPDEPTTTVHIRMPDTTEGALP